MDPTLADVFLADKWKINAPSKRAEHCLKAVALENAFNPVREYLESLRHLDLPEVTNEQLADCFGFNVEDNLSIDLMRLHLRACASRGSILARKWIVCLSFKEIKAMAKAQPLKHYRQNLAGTTKPHE
jgi:hypothetical protein